MSESLMPSPLQGSGSGDGHHTSIIAHDKTFREFQVRPRLAADPGYRRGVRDPPLARPVAAKGRRRAASSLLCLRI